MALALNVIVSALVLVTAAAFRSDEASSLQPVFKTLWVHVTLSMLGTVGFAVAFTTDNLFLAFLAAMFVGAVVAAIVAAGVVSWVQLRKEAYPDVGDTQVTVITQFPGRAAAEVEQQITQPLEDSLSGIEGVRALTSEPGVLIGCGTIGELTCE